MDSFRLFVDFFHRVQSKQDCRGATEVNCGNKELMAKHKQTTVAGTGSHDGSLFSSSSAAPHRHSNPNVLSVSATTTPLQSGGSTHQPQPSTSTHPGQQRQVTFEASAQVHTSTSSSHFHSQHQQHNLQTEGQMNESAAGGGNGGFSWSQIEHYLRNNPESLSHFVVNHVPIDQVRSWVDCLSSPSCSPTDDLSKSSPSPSVPSKASATQQAVKSSHLENSNVASTSATNMRKMSQGLISMPSQQTSGIANSSTESKVSSGNNTPARKVSAQEFDNGELDGVPVIDQYSGSFILDNDAEGSRLGWLPQQPSSPWSKDKPVDQELLLAELVKDIANELDNRLLFHKILQNLGRLVGAEKAFLYLVEGDKKSDCLFLVNALNMPSRKNSGPNSDEGTSSDSIPENEGGADEGSSCAALYVKIPLGAGIVGTVAKTGETINVNSATDDNRFVPGADSLLVPQGFKINSVLCLPILNVHQEVIGVAQVINKTGPFSNGCKGFDTRDVRISRTYLAFCGICVMNAKLYNRSRLESKRSKVLLEMAKCVFEEQSTVEVLVKRIMKELLNFLWCQRCSLLLFDTPQPASTLSEDLNYSEPLTLLHNCKTFHMGLSDLNESGQFRHSPQSDKESPHQFPLYFKFLEKCLQASVDTMVNISQPSLDPAVANYLSSVEPHFPVHSVLCSSIKNSTGELIGFVQLVNKLDVGFTKADEHFLEAFVIFCGLGISNTRMYEESVELFNKQRVAMEMVSYYTSASEAEIRSVLSHAPRSTRSFTLFTSSASSSGDAPNHISSSTRTTTTNRTNNTSSNNSDNVDRSRSLLDCTSMPAVQQHRGGNLNLSHGVSNESTSSAVSPGHRINMEITARKSSAPPLLQRHRQQQQQRTSDTDIFNFRLDELMLTEVDTLSSALAMFRELNLVTVLRTDEKTLVKWLVTTKKNYRQVTYHNWKHAFSVCQLMFAILTSGNLAPNFNSLQQAAFLLATLSHDLDHRGTNNSFQKLIESPLAQLYSTSTLEHHHFDRFKTILHEGSCNILANLDSADHETVVACVKHAIISTDLALYFQRRGEFFQLVQNNTFDIGEPAHCNLLSSMLMTASDLGAITRPWHVELEIAKMIAEEFFEQGDMEREMYNKDPIPMFDRNKQSEIPKLQLSFIDVICAPVYQSLAQLYPSLKPLLDGLNDNRRHWSELAAQEDESNEQHQ